MNCPPPCTATTSASSWSRQRAALPACRRVVVAVGAEAGNDDDPRRPSCSAFFTGYAAAPSRGGMKLIARSANAVMLSDGLTPGFAEIAEPSITYRPS